MKFTNVVFPSLLVVLLCLVTTVALRQRSVSNSSQPIPNQVVAAVAQSTGERGPVRMIRFVLLDNGLYPRQMRVNEGLVNLVVEDDTGLSNGLVVERVDDGEREGVTTIRRRAELKRSRELIRVTAGRYIVYDASKPNNRADLIVEP